MFYQKAENFEFVLILKKLKCECHRQFYFYGQNLVQIPRSIFQVTLFLNSRELNLQNCEFKTVKLFDLSNSDPIVDPDRTEKNSHVMALRDKTRRHD